MRRLLAVMLVLCLCVGGALAETPPLLTLGKHGNAVRELQQRLSDLGFLEGGVDGVYGKQTAASVRKAQQWLIQQGHPIREDGDAGPATLTLLYDDLVVAPRLDLKIGSRGTRVTRLQNRLYDLNFIGEAADGRFGPNTEQAVRELQAVLASHGAADVEVSGVVDKATRDALEGDLSPYGIRAPEFFDDTKPETLAGEFLNARAAIVLDAQTGDILFEKASDQRMFPASTTKVMTLLLAVEEGDLDRMVTIPACAGDVAKDSSLVPVYPGEEMPLRALLYGLMIRSGNDAANAVAEIVSGSIPGFVAAMNRKAAELGMTGTLFANPHGYHEDGHYTTARDLAILCAHAMYNEAFVEIVGARTYTMPPTDKRGDLVITSTTELLQPLSSHYYPGAYGIKSGFTSPAGFCYTGAAQKDGRTLIAVALKCRNRSQCWEDMKRLFNAGIATSRLQ